MQPRGVSYKTNSRSAITPGRQRCAPSESGRARLTDSVGRRSPQLNFYCSKQFDAARNSPNLIFALTKSVSCNFQPSQNEPFNFLNLDFYAQDTWKVTPTVSWTFGLRDTFNSNPLNPHNQIARLSGSFSSISHDGVTTVGRHANCARQHEETAYW